MYLMNKCCSILFTISLIIGCNLKEPSSKNSIPKKVYKPNISALQDSIVTNKNWDSIQIIQFWTFNCLQFEPYFDSTSNEIYYFKTRVLPQKSIHLLDSILNLTNERNSGPESTCEKGYQFIGYLKGEAYNLLIIDDCDMTKYGYLSQQGRKILAKICLDCKLNYKPCWSDSFYSK